MVDPEVARTAMEILLDHEVTVLRDGGGSTVVLYCTACAFLGDKEDPDLHPANVMLEYLEGYYKERYSND